MLHRIAAAFGTAVAIICGTAVYAFGLHVFILPNQLMEGGVTGISLLLNYAFGWRLSLSTLLLNLPLFALGIYALGWRQMIYTIIGVLSLSGSLAVMEHGIAAGWLATFATSTDYMLASLYAGVTIGLGLGIVFRFGGTTGGADIIARIVSARLGWSMGQIILVLDTLIISLSLLYIPMEKVLYTLVAVFIGSKLIDYVQEGAYAARAFTVITSQGTTVAAAIGSGLERGATLLPAVGAFTGQSREMVYCVVARHEIRKMKRLVRETDPTAFIVIHDVHDVVGEGFRPG
ncbi:membrane protein [Paenibacillus sp. 598K]|uniref:YitT family protein n=1 Tax=Paenibacillus sp. 598K TaxID=1117987 RepID=UPI000FF9AAB1|nr:YitT family protein [Paenibacillus sp. 598K]GBF72795.1 membrane protein [Paenibacillus sp. 598K]